MKTNVLVIRAPHGDRTEWGVSFNGPNPEPEDYFCMCEADAFRLVRRVKETKESARADLRQELVKRFERMISDGVM